MGRDMKKLRKLNNELDKKISSENQPVFTDMICYIRGASISDYDQELVRRDLSEMIIDAQSRGDSLEAVIGSDYKGFCDEVIGALPPKSTKQKIIDGADILCTCLAILGAISIISSGIVAAVKTGSLSAVSIPISVGTVVTFAVIIIAAVAVVEYIVRHPFEVDTDSMKGRIIVGIAAGGMMAALILIGVILRSTLFTVNLLTAVLVVLALFLAHLALDRL